MADSMDMHDHRSDRSALEARSGMMLGRMRYVLAISTALVVVAFFVIMAFF